MAKLKNEQISSSDLLEYLSSYSDFSFELSVLKMLRESDVKCEHGGHYQDPVTNKSREFDIRATKTIQSFRVRMAIECKNIRENFPLLISCVSRNKQDSYHQIAVVSTPKSKTVMETFANQYQSRATALRIRGNYSLYKQGELVGKSTVQVGRALSDDAIIANDSELYEKWGQCLSSANDLVERVYWDGYHDKESYQSAVVPFVVVPNNRLWAVAYDDEGNMNSDPKLTDRCSCFIGKDYKMSNGVTSTRMWLSHIEIVTFDGMRSFVKEHLETIEGMEKIFPKKGIDDAYLSLIET